MFDAVVMDTPINLEEALDLLAGKHDKFNARVRTVSSIPVDGFPRVKASFYYLSFQDGLPTIEQFVKYLKHQLVAFCIPRRDRMRVRAQMQADPDEAERLVLEQFEKARDLFIKAKEQQKKAGEPGELILFVLLEWALRAPQLISKMYLKTSREMPVHGTDGIHVGLHDDGVTLLLYWGESKLYADLSDALDAVFESVGDFVKDDGKRNREIDIVRDHMNLGEDQQALRDTLLDYLDPYSEKGNQRRHVFACFVGFDYAHYEQLRKLHPDQVENAFRELFEKRVTKAVELLRRRLGAEGMDVVNFEFFLIPFPSVQAFRTEFFKHTGIGNAE
ncbi:HamA C-terminal domain-containing protein [Azospirillum argentinense]